MLALLVALAVLPPPAPLEVLGWLAHPEIREASGIVRSRSHPGIFWVHNDSGNPPALFAVRRDGTLAGEFRVAIPNIDWEDIAADDRGQLYLGEIGNNGGRLPLRAIYRLDEPDPARLDAAPLAVTGASYYRFGPDGRFDAEALVVRGDRALVISKRLDGREAEVFAIPLDPPAPLLRPALPQRLGTLPGFTEAVTGADLSADGGLLAACSYGVARVYAVAGDTAWRPVGTVPFSTRDGIEAIAWDGMDL
ncbi:MAG TPA: hypothetical protein VF590_04035, partial [Isosphaeraceae bacterium]